MKLFDFTPLRKAIEKDMQWCINDYLKKDNHKVIRALYLYYSIDHENLHFDFFISDDTKDVYEYHPYDFSYESELNSDEVEQEYLKFYNALYESEDEVENRNDQIIRFNKMLVEAFKNLDYSQLKIHEDFLFWAEDHDGSFYYPNDTHRLK